MYKFLMTVSLLLILSCNINNKEILVQSPDSSIKLRFEIVDGEPTYSINKKKN